MVEQQPMNLSQLCYTALEDRRYLKGVVGTEGVSDVYSGALLVTTGGSGLNVSVAEGGAFINSDVNDDGVYWVYNDAAETLTATAANATNPRIDTVIAQVRDSDQGDGADDWVLSIVAGTPTGGATLANLTGAGAVPNRAIVLAYILVPATFTGPFVDATHILDARAPWVSGGTAKAPSRVVFTASGTFTKASYPGLRAVRVRAIGGGGGGGGANTTSTSSSYGVGGGSGGYAESLISASTLLASETVTVGAGGTGANGTAGNNGGSSIFGSYVTADGGTGGEGGASQAATAASSSPGVTTFFGGAGGATNTGDVKSRGGTGGPGFRLSAGVACGGNGGDAIFGGGGRGAANSSSASSVGTAGAANTGGGGGGSVNTGTQSPILGGAGGSGIVIVELIY